MQKYYLDSDAGGVKVGINGAFTVIFPNGCNELNTTVHILNDNEKLPYGARRIADIEGDNINIFEYDCGNKIIATLQGRYAVYNYWSNFIGEVFFIRFND